MKKKKYSKQYIDNPLVSVIIPIYNVEKYVEECVDSVVNQTYENFEIILINDGSTDTSVKKIKKYLDDSRIALKSQNNQGLSAARNRGLEKATGKYVLFIDSDDFVERTMIEKLVHRAETAEADLVRFNADTSVEEGLENTATNVYDFSHRLDSTKTYKNEAAVRANRRSLSASACLYMVKRQLLKDNELRFPIKLLHEDEWFTTLVFLHTRTLVYLNEPLYHRRYRASSIMTEKNAQQERESFDSYFAIYQRLEEILHKMPLTREQKKLIKRQLLSLYNGMEKSETNKMHKNKQLKTLTGLSLFDKMYLRVLRYKKSSDKKVKKV